jgi:hypothetical protein
MADEEKGGAPTPSSARLPSARSPVASAKPALIRLHVRGSAVGGMDVLAFSARFPRGMALRHDSCLTMSPHDPTPSRRALPRQVHVMDAVIDVSCGEGTNTVRWMAHVAIAMYDRAGCKGYLQLGAWWVFPVQRSSIPLARGDCGAALRPPLVMQCACLMTGN